MIKSTKKTAHGPGMVGVPITPLKRLRRGHQKLKANLVYTVSDKGKKREKT